MVEFAGALKGADTDLKLVDVMKEFTHTKNFAKYMTVDVAVDQ